MLNTARFNTICFNSTAMLRKLLSLTVDALFKKFNIESLTVDLRIIDRIPIKSITSDLLLKKSTIKNTSSNLIITFKYIEKINLKSYIRTVEDVYLGRDGVTIYRTSKLDFDQM